MKTHELSLGSLYRLPFSMHDNPNAWLEITTHCNMTCPGCYRGCNRSDNDPRHVELEQVKALVRQLKAKRNCQTISISGGEPLMHPNIRDIVAFIKAEGLNPVMLTNGLLLKLPVLKELRKAGLTAVIVRVDSLREHDNVSEASLHDLREQHARVCHAAGLFMGFTCVVDQSNLAQIPDVIHWVQDHHEQVDLLLLIMRRQIIFNADDVISDEELVSLSDLHTVLIREFPELRYHSFLGSSLCRDDIKWLQSSWVSLEKKILGYADSGFPELIQKHMRRKTGSYCSIVEKSMNYMSLPRLMLLSLVNRGMRSVFLRTLWRRLLKPGLWFKKPNLQLMILINPPGFQSGVRDLCESCPDAMLYEGKLVPSCLLEEYKSPSPGGLERAQITRPPEC